MIHALFSPRCSFVNATEYDYEVMQGFFMLLIKATTITFIAFLTCAITAIAQPSDSSRFHPDDVLYGSTTDDYENLAALLLATEVKTMYGGNSWDDSSFSFVSFDYVYYSRDKKEISRYSHTWNRKENTATVIGETPDGRPWRADFTDLMNKKGTVLIDSVPVLDQYLSSALTTAYSRITADVRLLLLPLMFGEPFVKLTREPDSTMDKGDHSVLRTIITDASKKESKYFKLLVNPVYYNIEVSVVEVQGREIGYSWLNYARLGPILIATKRKSKEDGSYIKFENIKVVVNDKVYDQLKPDEK